MTAQPSLYALRRRLVLLGRARRVRRWLCGMSALLTSLVWVLAAVLLIDVLFELDRVQRLTVFALALLVFCWAIHRFVRPHFGRHETEIDVALLVERLHGIDTDLVAAIEFTEPEAAFWGSATLQKQVIEDVAQRALQFDMTRGVDRRQPLRKLGALLVTSTLAAAIAVQFPQYMSVFLRRLALSDDHYPSRTAIGSIVVNGQRVLRAREGLSPRPARCPERGPVEVLVRCDRHAPQAGELVLTPITGTGQSRLPLTRSAPTDSAARSHETFFIARLPALLDSLEYQVYLGDAWTNRGVIEMVPLPQIEVRAAVSPPSYTGAKQSTLSAESTYRITVLEGSQVDLAVTSANEKRLRTVWIELQAAGKSARRELTNAGGADSVWQLDSTTFQPLRSVHDTVQFTVHAIDHDGLQPTRLPSGEIRVQSDLPPDAVAATIHRVVLPTAKPQITYQVDDDFGIGRLRLQVQIERHAPSREVPPDAVSPAQVAWLELENAIAPLSQADLPYTNRCAVDLKRWQLKKGDRLKVTVEATDYRGAIGGASVMSKPLYLEISDQAGVLSAILEADQRTEKELDEMIRRQLGLRE